MAKRVPASFCPLLPSLTPIVSITINLRKTGYYTLQCLVLWKEFSPFFLSIKKNGPLFLSFTARIPRWMDGLNRRRKCLCIYTEFPQWRAKWSRVFLPIGRVARAGTKKKKGKKTWKPVCWKNHTECRTPEEQFIHKHFSLFLSFSFFVWKCRYRRHGVCLSLSFLARRCSAVWGRRRKKKETKCRPYKAYNSLLLFSRVSLFFFLFLFCPPSTHPLFWSSVSN